MYEVFLPAVEDREARSALQTSLRQLEDHIGEFQGFMGRVETGKVKVTKNIKGLWFSTLEQDSCIKLAIYPGRLEPVSQFDKRRNRDPFHLMYEFDFYPNGMLRCVRTLEDGESFFDFDEQGAVQSFEYMTANGNREVIRGPDGTILYRLFAK